MFSKAFLHQIEGTFGNLLLDSGFDGRAPNWVRVREPFIDCVDLQMRSDNIACCVNLGEHLTFLPVAGGSLPINIKGVSTADCEIRTRLTPERASDKWWKINEAKAGKEMADCFQHCGKAFFDKFVNFPEPFKSITLEAIDSEPVVQLMPALTKVRRVLLVARVHYHVGDEVHAADWAEFGKQIAGKAVGPKAAFQEILRKCTRV